METWPLAGSMTAACTNAWTPASDSWQAGLPRAWVSWNGVDSPFAVSGSAGTISVQSTAAGGGVGAGVGVGFGFAIAAAAAPCGVPFAASWISPPPCVVCDNGATVTNRRPTTTAPRIFTRMDYYPPH